MKLKYSLVAITFFVLNLIGNAVCGQQPQHNLSAWMNETWSSKDPYKRLRVNIDAKWARTTNHADLLSQYRQEAEIQPSDSQKLFKWAYSLYLYIGQMKKRDMRQLNLAKKKLEAFPAQNSYEYSRMRFLIESLIFPSPALKKVGLQLLKRNKNDIDVNYYILDTLDITAPQERGIALSSAKSLVRLSPKRASSYAALGWIYFRVWRQTKSEQDKKQAVANYQTYLKLAPTNDTFRPQAMKIIAVLKGNSKS